MTGRTTDYYDLKEIVLFRHISLGERASFPLCQLIDTIKSITESITTLSVLGAMGLGDRAQKTSSFPEGDVPSQEY